MPQNTDVSIQSIPINKVGWLSLLNFLTRLAGFLNKMTEREWVDGGWIYKIVANYSENLRVLNHFSFIQFDVCVARKTEIKVNISEKYV